MKKILTILSFAAAITTYAQGRLIINNYTPYDFQGHVIAHGTTSPCYPRVVNNTIITVPADANTGNGNHLQYDNYRDQFGSSLYPMADWNVSTSPNNNSVVPWNDLGMIPGGTLSNTTKWGVAKFGMVYAGTNNNVVGFSANLALAGNACYASPDNFTTSNGLNSGEIFVITSGGTVTTYLQMY
ncbi:hypothetical protein ACM46_07005 [Chryseobacterium angstadtii]|uniref:Uncharacterized protein n=1 Tax=Chryseobacterium angstadtii TaxID=558151 RepID=A0A0J7L9D2_9FLAO|nr:hypothetical protein [Chryseobacterium angstadtii]KMQ65620.1 hypothetical protein ACM46_07005 [Chryseobacterium angstadtii]